MLNLRSAGPMGSRVSSKPVESGGLKTMGNFEGKKPWHLLVGGFHHIMDYIRRNLFTNRFVLIDQK